MLKTKEMNEGIREKGLPHQCRRDWHVNTEDARLCKLLGNMSVLPIVI